MYVVYTELCVGTRRRNNISVRFNTVIFRYEMYLWCALILEQSYGFEFLSFFHFIQPCMYIHLCVTSTTNAG